MSVLKKVRKKKRIKNRNNRQKYFYSGKKKRHTLKTQVVVTLLPKRKSKNQSLTKEDKKNNTDIASQRVYNEHAIGFIKRFKIVAERYRNRRKRFGLRFNLIAGICNYEK